ncbi:hypothetical protein [Cellulosimicrobium sp. Marseille-Q4280]|uniref:hypothetical protein n=1 Tax=Cellulosimicrobium sp. Marseille-Q4280 TaxID=2937992 RepID=UPI00203C9D67|nr:hypothetical protein [Cellulosimicrobium sp. Marseille-Q4280]
MLLTSLLISSAARLLVRLLVRLRTRVQADYLDRIDHVCGVGPFRRENPGRMWRVRGGRCERRAGALARRASPLGAEHDLEVVERPGTTVMSCSTARGVVVGEQRLRWLPARRRDFRGNAWSC